MDFAAMVEGALDADLAKAQGGRIGVCLDVKIGHVGTEVYGQPQLNRWLGEVAAALEAATRGSDAPTTA